PGAVRIESEARPDQDLDRGVRAGDDVATDVVGVVGLQVSGGAKGRPDDPLPEAGSEALDLPQNGLRRIPGVAAGNVCVDPEWVQVALRATRGGEVLLPDAQVGELRDRAAIDGPLGDRDLLERAGDVHRPRAPAGLVGPRDPTLHREVELERPRAVAEVTVGAGDSRRQAIACDLGDGARSKVEGDDVRPADLIV